jgi:uncharacterized protein
MPNPRAAFLGLAATRSISAPPAADSHPTLRQIYDQAGTGHLDRAQQMIHQVMVDHPRSAKAHYVAAELASQAGKLTAGCGELKQAEELDPGLPFATPAAVRALRSALGVGSTRADSWRFGSHEHIFPWFPGILLQTLGAIIWAIVRSRNAGPTGSTLGTGLAGGWTETAGDAGDWS